MGETGDAPLAGGDELLTGEFGRGVEIERLDGAVEPKRLGRKGMQMRLVARRHLQRCRVDLDEVAFSKNRRSADWMRLRPIRKGRRSAWTSGVHQGEACGMVGSVQAFFRANARSGWLFARN